MSGINRKIQQKYSIKYEMDNGETGRYRVIIFQRKQKRMFSTVQQKEFCYKEEKCGH